MRKRNRLEPSPIVRHTVCGSTFAAGRLAIRHGRLQGLPLYCRKCRCRIFESEIEPVNDIALREMIFWGIRKDPATPVPVPIDVDF